MTRESRVIVYSEGAFQPAPGWYREAEELEAGGLDWQKALSRVLGTDHDQYAESLGDVGIEIRVWRSTGLGAYVETGDCIRTWDAVWVPLPSDWWPFQARYLLPLIASASNLAIAERLNRIGNALIAYSDMTGTPAIHGSTFAAIASSACPAGTAHDAKRAQPQRLAALDRRLPVSPTTEETRLGAHRFHS